MATKLSRPLQPTARDTSVIADGEVDLVPILLHRDGDAVLDFADAGNFAQAIPAGFLPQRLLLVGDGSFYEGQAAVDQAANLPRAAGVLYLIPVAGRDAWHLARPDGAATVTVRGKLLLAS